MAGLVIQGRKAIKLLDKHPQLGISFWLRRVDPALYEAVLAADEDFFKSMDGIMKLLRANVGQSEASGGKKRSGRKPKASKAVKSEEKPKSDLGKDG